MKTHIKSLILILSATSLIACDRGASPEEIAVKASEVAACPAGETYLHDSIQENLEKFGSIPSSESVLSAFEDKLNTEKELKSLSSNLTSDLSESFKAFYTSLENEIEKAESKEEALKALGKLEFGSHEDKELQKNYSQNVKDFQSLAAQVFSTCQKPNESSSEENISEETKEAPITSSDFFEELKNKTSNLSHYGAMKSFAIAYQSCEALDIDALTDQDEDMEGIKIVGNHPGGIGNIREIGSFTKVRRTHPYIKNYRKPASNCVDSTKKPLIYDFGGKPASTTSASSSLNFFKDAGSGSKELGVDCSGYVFSALMTAGLKLSPNKPLRARNVNSIPARFYMNPGSRMSCIKKVKAGAEDSLRSGDIFASRGHIFIVVKIGEDPLGVKKALNTDTCSSITSDDFDFTLMQSSPVKGAIGMNHMDGRDYMKTSTSMKKGLEKFARLDCKNKKSGRTTTPSIEEASLVRHLMTPECVTEKNLKLDKESCVKRCSYNG